MKHKQEGNAARQEGKAVQEGDKQAAVGARDVPQANPGAAR